MKGRAPLAVAAAMALAGCASPDPQAEVSVSAMEAYWAVDRPSGGTQYLAPVVRFRLQNKGGKPHRSIQVSATFRRKGEEQAWSGAFTQVAPLPGSRPLDPGQEALVVLKPEGEGRYTSTVPPEQMLAHEQFRDVWAEVYVRVGSSPWTKMAQADVERRIGARAAAAEAAGGTP